MIQPRRPAGGPDLAREVEYWLRMQEENRELKDRVASALDDIRAFVDRQRSDLQKRKGKLIQTSGFKDETRGMEAAIARIHQLLTDGRNVSDIFTAIDDFLETYQVDDTFAREHTRVQLADAREDFICAFHDSVRGTRLAELLDILYFMPYSFWRSRGLERRNYRSPSAAEVQRLLGELGQRGVDVNSIDTAQLAAIMRMKLGITPRMDYHLMTSNKLAELFTSEATISRFTSREVPLDAGFCRTAGGILANIRRWTAECLGSESLPSPAEIEAEMLQVACLSGDTLRISGSEDERAADYLWLLSTVIASAHSPLREALAGAPGKNVDSPSLHRRIMGAKGYLDQVAVLADRALLYRWSEAKGELDSLIARTEGIVSKGTLEFGEFTELEQLKEKRSDVVKSLIKISESLRLVEPTLQDLLTSRPPRAMRPLAAEHLRTLAPRTLTERNSGNAEETRTIARQELERLRLLIARITTISRKGLADSAAHYAQERRRAGEKPSRKTADGADLGAMPAADLHAVLHGLLRKAALALGEFKGKVEGVKKRTFKGDLQHALLVFGEKVKTAAEACDGADLDVSDPALAAEASQRIVPLLREIMVAQSKVSTRVNSSKLTPAEKQPLLGLLHATKNRIGDDLRDMELIRAELAERATPSRGGSREDAASAELVAAAAPEAAACGADIPREGTLAAATTAPAEASQAPAARNLAALASAANNALKPVKELLTGLRSSISAKAADNQVIRAAAQALKCGLTEARDLVTWNLMQVEVIAADGALATDEYVEKFGRWQAQLLALGKETDRLLKATEDLAALESAFRAAAALEREISETVKLLSVQDVGVDDLVALRGRCLVALETMASLSERLPQALKSLAGAAKAEWRILKTASGYLEPRSSDLAGYAAELKVWRARVEKIRTFVESQLPRSG